MNKRTKLSLAVLIVLVVAVATGNAQNGDGRDLNDYKWRVEGNGWFWHPSGYFGARSSNNYVDVSHDFGFSNYSTFTGNLDYRFRAKHHLLLNITPSYNSRTATLNRVIDFQGQEFEVGSQVSADLHFLNIAPGYQYDILRRNHGLLGIELDLNLIDTKISLQVAGNVNGQSGSGAATRSSFYPLPAVGPVFRWYPLHDSNRLSFDGSVRGMYFFGYGDFVSARGNVSVGLTEHLALRGGYQLGSRLSIHGTSDEIAVRLTHKGPTAGLEYSWGEVPQHPAHEAPKQPSDWHVEWIPLYLWFSGMQGNVGARGYVVPVNASFTDVFSDLNIGLMSVLDVRRKRIGLMTDLIFMSLSSDQKSTPIQQNAFSGFTANAKTLIVDPEAYCRLLEKPRGSIDAVAGGRFWHLNNSLDLLAGTLPATTAGQTQSWVDPVLGARFRLNLNKGWFVNLKGDAGGFGVGSQLTYQIYSGVGKEFKERYSLLLGYRYLSVDYTNAGFLYDTHMSGLVSGFGIRFR
jgi:hypothetical protein